MSASNRTPERVAAFCAALAETANVGRACRALGMGRTTAYDWREEDPDFAEKWDRAMRIGVTALEDEATRRAFEGVDDPVIHQGQFQYALEPKLTRGGKPVLDRTTKQPVMVAAFNEDGTRKLASVKKYSDSLAAMLLKAHAPDKYRDNSKVEMAGSLEFSGLSTSELQEQIAMLETQLATAAAAPKTATSEPEDSDDEPA